MRDIIDERNEKERISKSIVKFWNVNYVPAPYKPEKMADAQTPDERAAEGEQVTELSDEFYNRTTRSYSGTYGLEPVENEVTKGQIDRILHEKDEELRHLLDENFENS